MIIDKFTAISNHRFRVPGNCYSDRGSILPAAIGLGLIVSLLGVVMLVRSHNDETNVAMRRAIAKSESVAELGISRYRNLMNNNRKIATLPSCSNTDSAEICDADSWYNAAAVISNPTAADLISSQVSEEWKPVSPDAPDAPVSDNWQDGQYRLINYTYDDDAGEGTLTVEGRVNQGADGAGGVGTTVRRLEVKFPVNVGGGNFPPLWIGCNMDPSSTGIDTIAANIKDSTPNTPPVTPEELSRCSGVSDPSGVTQLQGAQVVKDPPYDYDETPDDPFPPLPAEGTLAHLATIPADEVCIVKLAISTVVYADEPITLPAKAETDPNFCKSGTLGTYYTYNVTETVYSDGTPTVPTISIGLSAPNRTLKIDAPGQTVKLYTKRVILSGLNTKIQVTPGTKLIIYAHDVIDLSANSTSMGGDFAHQLQIYQYSNNRVALQSGQPSTAFIFSPYSYIQLASNNLLTGAAWVRYISTGTGSRFTAASNIDCANLISGICSGSGGDNTIGTITSWKVVPREP